MTPDVQTAIPAAPVLIIFWLVVAGAATTRLRRRRQLTTWRFATVVSATTYVAAVLAVTLLPLQVALGRYANQVAWFEKINFIPLVTIDSQTFVLNMVMTVPLGMLAPLLIATRTPRRAALVGFLFSLAIELVQAFSNVVLSSGRTGDVNDLLANTIGAVLGWYVFARVRATRGGARILRRLSLPGGSFDLDGP